MPQEIYKQLCFLRTGYAGGWSVRILYILIVVGAPQDRGYYWNTKHGKPTSKW